MGDLTIEEIGNIYKCIGTDEKKINQMLIKEAGFSSIREAKYLLSGDRWIIFKNLMDLCNTKTIKIMKEYHTFKNNIKILSIFLSILIKTYKEKIDSTFKYKIDQTGEKDFEFALQIIDFIFKIADSGKYKKTPLKIYDKVYIKYLEARKILF